ncbi:SapC family protein [Novosphingobium olei]|uniref:SapC family protein n=1 Tax=Novosphingobium olei TaxID=2728851 RepID=UPI00308ED700|nr:SapC family protein [Novosphingobium olei]
MSNHAVLNPADHGDLRIDTGASAALGDDVMACITVPAEFRSVQAHYPIVLRRDLATGKLEALALLGFETGENLFLRDGAWDAPYRPLSMAIRPFLVGRAAAPDAAPQVHVDLDHPRISTSGEGVRVFDASGQPTPYLEDIAAKLGDLDHAYRESGDFFAAVDRHDLAESFTLEVTLDDGAKNSLVGYHTINEEKLSALDGAALADLMAGGHLARIYMIIASLSHFGDLVARKNAKVRGG